MDRIDELLLIEDQANGLKRLKNKLAIKIDDIPVQLQNLEKMINYPKGNLKNSEGKTLTEALEKVNELYQHVLIEFQNSLYGQADKIYENKKNMFQS